MRAKAWKHDDAKQPPFPDDYSIVKKAVLQVTDLKANNNKYYALEQHSAQLKGKSVHRVFTHYGRTDDLEQNPEAGMRESRYFDTAEEAQREYEKLFKAKTGTSKGYQEVQLASAKIGSAKARESAAAVALKPKKQAAPSSLPEALQALVSYIYAEATEKLTTTVSANITSDGIETPLGALTLAQIAKGEKILDDLYHLFQTGTATKKQLQEGSGDFYSAIPHRLGRSRDAVAAAVIDSLAQFNEKQETLQLMKDMLTVNGEHGSVLFDSQVDRQYQALGAELQPAARDSAAFAEISEQVTRSQVARKAVKVVDVYTVKRPPEHAAFRAEVGNERRLFHGSRIANWVGILSRGMLMPKIVVSMGGNRTDAGWLGNGLYFADDANASAFYTTAGRRNTRLMVIARVALGEVKEYTKITPGLSAPPPGYHSVQGVRRSGAVKSQFDDNEYVIFDEKQQRIEHLVEFTA